MLTLKHLIVAGHAAACLSGLWQSSTAGIWQSEGERGWHHSLGENPTRIPGESLSEQAPAGITSPGHGTGLEAILTTGSCTANALCLVLTSLILLKEGR